MKLTYLFLVATSIAISGCFTCCETEYPDVTVTAVPSGKKISVQIPDFKLSVVKYRPVKGHESMIPGAPEEENVLADTYGAYRDVRWEQQNKLASRIIGRAIAELKRKGYDIVVKNADYVVRIEGDGPIRPNYDVLRQASWLLCSIFTAGWNEVTWKMKLSLVDRSGKTVFSKDYEQTYSVTVWGPIPIASPGCHDMMTEPPANSWALTAMADRAFADATAFMAEHSK